MSNEISPARKPSIFVTIGRRVVPILLLAFMVGWILNHLSASMEKTSQPAGFTRGMLQGALMPMAMPNLILGHDVTIYSLNNTGRTYKIGFTAGVNGCGAIFFGFCFWRYDRWRGRSRTNGGGADQK